jgi:prepilin-type N-terminal cleavage/methylation domain-containing protein
MSRTQNGFTLVELAIVMLIIGLLIGGILKGAAIVQNARVNKVISTVKEIEAATYTFKDSYGHFPGDSRYARNRVPGCSASNYCINGDGNNFIASDGSDHVAWRSNIIAADRSTNGEENIQFWKHLALADLISIVVPSADPSKPAWGSTHPTSSFGGGFEVYYDGWMASGSGGGVSSHVMRFSYGLNTRADPVLQPSIAARIDKKMDDGDASSGDVIANYGTRDDNCKSGNRYSGVYDETDNRAACILYFKILE